MATTLRDLDVDLITRGHLEKGLAQLRDEFAGTFSAETVERFMAESLEALGGARLKNFVRIGCPGPRVRRQAPRRCLKP